MAYTTINKSSDYFNTKLYTGNGSTNAITGVGFQPDFIWNKQRNGTYDHYLFNSLSGTGKYMKSNTTGSEGTNSDTVTSFDSDGFTLGNAAGNNGSGNTMASWNWLGANGTTANTDGSISSTVSANTTSGFSIVKWTGNNGAGATVGHGLGSIPKIVLVKNIQQSGYDWVMYHASLGNTKRIWLNLTNAVSTNTGSWNNTTPSSSVFTLGSSGETNGSGEMIGYCFAEKKGYSKFGSYTGNGSADGTFVYTGFKPAFVIYKGAVGSATVDNWEMADNKRSPFNGIENVLYPNLANAEGTGVTTRMDMLSNGFKMRTNGTDYNGNGTTYIYMAFAEAPLVGTNGVTAKAR
jgi:hypothetical protein